ncbi:MAG: DUF3429 domain-containing protein [Gammaproteobacteria bacterium]|nr:DUF3429 domain-containing protein [Gammaproteobacteria bacterium]MBV9696931.1 DUF3429 domain-containing protein [Gammaproteobacteria bacterium]
MASSTNMPHPDHTATWPATAAAHEWAAYLCVAPLLVTLAVLGLAAEVPVRELAQRVSVAWGASLLAFTGAVHWGLIFAGRMPAHPRRIAAALVPALCAALAVVIGGQKALALLVVGFGLFWLYEHRALGTELPPGYLNLRRPLVIATCLLLAVTMLVSESAGLS